MAEWTLPLARKGQLRVRRPLVMGILNATPDSFSDGGRLATLAAIEARVRQLVADGADVLDVGGESTRPGHAPVSANEEARRVVPVVQACKRIAPDVPVSIDTRKAAVARWALTAGADFVNDVSALADPHMAAAVREAGCAVVLMRDQALAGEPVAACRAQLAALLAKATAVGIAAEATVLDPGLGFGDPPGADVDANLALVRGVAGYSLGRPVLIGASRKRFIGTIMGEPVPERRVAGSVEVAVQAAQAGASFLRVHDVKETVAALRAQRPG